MDHENEIKIKADKGVIFSILITAILVLAISFLIFKYLPESKKQLEIDNYKKEIFEGAYCQYSCPLTEQTIQNKTQLLPEQACLQQCAGDITTRQLKTAEFSENDLKKDNLFLDIETLANTCRNSSINQTAQLPTLNNGEFFKCMSQGLENLRNNFEYLKD